ncbi:hypothetical protein BON30_29860 [Cystobacter ferrugineus]|uniref:Uncharacterized protein n=1 Tax=Cystobacter ferrugineus TaxID=83449 RepID=A0A1L9B5F5_9BACT|nr:hypothetical protein BON30_29860 [Cystobacter ferrugineus]
MRSAKKSPFFDENHPLWNGWSKWLPLTKEGIKDAPRDAGAYLLRVRQGQRGRVRALSRLLRRDPNAILDIGQSGGLRVRLLRFLACAADDDVRGHMAGWRYRYLKLHERLPGRLEFCFVTGVDPVKMEARLMTEYLDDFGELPPLNYQFNWS